MSEFKKKYDVVLCVGSKDIFIVRTVIKCIRDNMDANVIYIISNKKHRFLYLDIYEKYNVCFIDENKLIKGLSITSLKSYISDNNSYLLSKLGWYFQQFLKMSFSISQYASDNYLIWDADTIPTRNICFFENNKILICKKTEHHKDYFNTMENLLGYGKLVDFSFISEHMMVKTSYMKDLLNVICEKDRTIIFWQNIIKNIGANTLLGFSEFETYGNFLVHNYNDSFAIRDLKTNRNAGSIYGRTISKKELAKITDFDTISLEPSDKPCLLKKIKQLPCRIAVYIISKI